MIKAIKAYNFQSWKELEISFEEGTTLVAGNNLDDNTGEGSGKSAIFNAVTWCIWGKLPKEANIDAVITIGQKDCEVYIYLEDGNLIWRRRNPNDLGVWKIDGSELSRGKDMKDTQKIINELVGMSFETFCSSIYFPQNYEKKFITSNEEEKAKVLSEIQDLTIFDRAAKKAHENAKTQASELEKVNLAISYRDMEYSSLKERLKTLETFEAGFIANKVSGLSDLQSRLDQNKDKIIDLQTAIGNLKFVRDQVECANLMSDSQKELTAIENKLYAIELLKLQKSAMPGICPTCDRPLDATDKHEIEVPDNSVLLDHKAKVKNTMVEIGKDLEQIQLVKIQRNQFLSNIELLQTEQKQIVRDLEKLQNTANDYEAQIYLILDQLNTLTGVISDLRSKSAHMASSLKIFTFLKSGFKEIKSHVFQSLLNDLNVKSNFYIREFFDVPCSIKFTNVSAEGELSKIQTKVMLNNNEYTLGLLSGGQFRRVQLAVDFAISEIIAARSNKKINMRILDEPFKDLSEEKQVKILEFLKKMPGKTLIIEHSPIIKSFVDQEINITLENGISRLTSKS